MREESREKREKREKRENTPRSRGFDCGVDQSLSPRHTVEIVLLRPYACEEAISHETTGPVRGKGEGRGERESEEQGGEGRREWRGEEREDWRWEMLVCIWRCEEGGNSGKRRKRREERGERREKEIEGWNGQELEEKK